MFGPTLTKKPFSLLHLSNSSLLSCSSYKNKIVVSYQFVDRMLLLIVFLQNLVNQLPLLGKIFLLLLFIIKA